MTNDPQNDRQVRPPAIEIDALGVRHGGRWVLRDFSLTLARGEKVTLAGPSGAGKSTVLRCVLGLAVPQEGQVNVEGRPMSAQSVWQLRQRMAYVAQEPDFGPGTAREIIERPFEYKANAALRPNLDRLGELMERFNLAHALLDQEVATLSGGEKQRIALLSAIVLDRPIILLDEASSALDKANSQAVAQFIGSQRDLTVLSVSHNAEWESFSGRTVELSPPASPAREGGDS
jgi:ABC-type iron transport system FetAB ATPase subunit